MRNVCCVPGIWELGTPAASTVHSCAINVVDETLTRDAASTTCVTAKRPGPQTSSAAGEAKVNDTALNVPGAERTRSPLPERTSAERSRVPSKRLPPACDVVTVCVEDGVAVGDGEPVPLRVPESEGVCVPVSLDVWVSLGDPVFDGVADADVVCFIEEVTVPEGVLVVVGVPDALAVSVVLGVDVPDAVCDWEGVLDSVGVPEVLGVIVTVPDSD